MIYSIFRGGGGTDGFLERPELAFGLGDGAVFRGGEGAGGDGGGREFGAGIDPRFERREFSRRELFAGGHLGLVEAGGEAIEATFFGFADDKSGATLAAFDHGFAGAEIEFGDAEGAAMAGGTVGADDCGGLFREGFGEGDGSENKDGRKERLHNTYLHHIVSTKQRLISLDAFRGATIAAMMLVNNLGSHTSAYAPLLHAEWHGLTPTDLIFPFFLWMVGVAMTFSFARRVEEGGDKTVLIRHTVRRSALIFGLGLLLAGFPYYDWATIRIPGVLQRIAVCYLIGALVFLYTTWKGQAVVIVGVCTAYWMLMTLYPVPGFGPGVLEPIGNFSQYIDWMLLPGHLYKPAKVWDPEGIISTLPAIATLLFGALAGHLLRSKRELAEKCAWLLATGVVLTLVGYALGLAMPINKKIWTVSFAVVTAGLAQLGLGAFYWFIDGQGWKRWATPLVHYGSNAIVVYALSGLVARLWNLSGWRQPVYEVVFVPLGSPAFASMCFGLAHVLGLYFVAWFLYRKQWVIRL